MRDDAPVFVHVDLNGQSVLAGRLWTRATKGQQRASFAYDDGWLDHPDRFALEPALSVDRLSQHTAPGKALFGSIGDSSPDRWGRALMNRAEAQAARDEGRTPRGLLEVDYLLGVHDLTRQGALRFSVENGGPFLADSARTTVPPLVDLSRLLAAAEHVVGDAATDDDLQLLLAPGSSLGGARPKASVCDTDGSLAIAKFTTAHDDHDVVLGEALALTLAGAAGIRVPVWRAERIAGKTVLIVARFDRVGARRVPFLSAMSMLGAVDGEQRSYLEIADALREHGAAPAEDLAELWRRIVFTVLISNTDDHLRNHAFLHESTAGWRLSPVYDVNPTPASVRPRVLSTAIDETDSTASLETALSVAEYFGVTPDAARARAAEIARVTAGWRSVATRLGLTRRDVDRIASAFEHDDLRAARQL